MRGWVGVLLLLSCGRTQPVRPPPLPPVFPCELSVEPRALDFGTQSPGGTAVRELVLRNEGDGLCTLEALALGGANDPTFTIEAPALPHEIGPDESRAFKVIFSAGTAAPPLERKGTLEVRTTDVAEPRVEVTLSARVEFCQLTARPNPYDLGNVILNATRDGHITLRNDGSLRCDVTGLALAPGSDANFTMAPQPSFSLEPGASADVPVRFMANTSAPPHRREATLLFHSNDPVTPDGRVPISAYINTVCTEAGQYIYTVDADGRFSRFDPRTLTYLEIAALNCPTVANPYSMNVDQNATAWVIFGGGQLFRVDTATGACSATSFQPNQLGFSTFGMGSVFDSMTGVDTLFIATSSQLGTIAFPSLMVTRVGPIPLNNAELAGTGDGQLWAFAPANGGGIARLVRLDPTNSMALEQYDLPNLNSTGGWAIKFFGGAFFVFVGSDVWKIERSSLDPRFPAPTTPPVKVLTSPGRDIVGAGNSTCAPTG